MPDLAYPLVRNLVHELGGSMEYQREGYRHGAWIIRIENVQVAVEASGNRSFPQLDQLHVPAVPEPVTWDDYAQELVPDAKIRLLKLVGVNDGYEPLTGNASDRLEAAVGRARWKFAWSYARTYPHEYTAKDKSDAADHALLIQMIEQHGVIERFGKDRRKYLYFAERKYWHMGDPYSPDPEQRPNVINRTWVDVRRHAENVAHVWTPEEVELQKRLWEIQLEKTTDRPRNQ